MRNIWMILSLLFLFGCTTKHTPFPKSSTITRLNSPVQLNPGQTEIFLSDFFPDASIIDSVFIEGKPVRRSPDNARISYSAPRDSGPLIEMQLWSGGSPYSVLLKRSGKQTINIEFDPQDKLYEQVQLAGEFNGWTPGKTPLEYKDGRWETALLLNPGKYQYQFVIDGQWSLDPANPDSMDNNAGGYNSVLTAGKENYGFKPFLFTDEIEIDEVEIGFINEVDEFFVFWQNFRLDDSFIEIDDDDIEISIPAEARDMQRSFIRVWAYNSYGVSNDILVPLSYGRVIESSDSLNVQDHQALILYNIFVDRFYNDDVTNDAPVDDPGILPRANYHGGDIRGILKKVKEAYFDSLGVNTIWISPLVLNPEGAYGLWTEPRSKFSGYHGYWPVSFTQIDPRFGTSDELHELVQVAHQKNMNVLLDFVANHVHELHPVYQQHPDWATDLYLPDGSLNTERWDEYRLTTWFDVFLPTLDLERPEVTGMLSDSAVWWIREYHLDGFRHDATKHIPEFFWRTLTRKLREQVEIPENRLVYQIGETYGSPELISGYVGSGMLDGQFDFNVYDAALGAFARPDDSFESLHGRLLESLSYYGNHNLMGYITGNQDRGRFISYAGGDLGFDEDAKLAGWTREIGVGDEVGYKKLQSLIAFNMTIPGVPVIYYGDEFGMPGGNDPDSRRMMKFTGLAEKELETREITSYLAKLRRDNLALIYGDFVPLVSGEKHYAFARKYFDQAVIVVFNKSLKPLEIKLALPDFLEIEELNSHFGHPHSFNDSGLSINLPPNSFEILTNK